MNFPTVTEVLQLWTQFDQVPPDILAAACGRGHEVHSLAALYAKGLWIMEVPECLAGYFASYQNWFDTYVNKVYLVEERLTDETLGITGMPDLVVEFYGDTRLVLPDLKTGKVVSKTWPIQTSTYRYLAKKKKGLDVERTMTLRLQEDGKPPLINEFTRTMNQDFNIFCSALNCWRYFSGK